MNKYAVSKLPSDILKEVAMRHKNYRKQMKLSQSELAVRSGVSLGSIKRFESTGQISFESMLKLAHILNCFGNFDALFENKDNTREIEKLFDTKTKK